MLESDLDRLYQLIEARAQAAGRPRFCELTTDAVPRRGVYFVFEDGEVRKDGRDRVVRVGTHATTGSSETVLWKRIKQHRGSDSGAGNHRGSIFRLRVGQALLASHASALPRASTWAKGSRLPALQEERDREAVIEHAVSERIGQMRVVCFGIDDAPGKGSWRGNVERWSLALLGEASRCGLEHASSAWLGRCCPHEMIASSGLWNVRHLNDDYEPSFLDVLEGSLASG